MNSPRLRDMFTGALSGFVATVPQTAAMEVARIVLPTDPGRFPPRQVTEAIIARLLGRRRRPPLGEPAWWGLTTVSHFGFGTTVGTFYPLMPKAPKNVPLRGALYGVGVWAFAYFVMLPLLGVHTPQADQPVRKNLQLVIAHLAWGASAAMIYERLRGLSRRGSDER